MSNRDFSKICQDFPMLLQKMHGKPLVYFDTAATAQKPACVIDHMQQFMKSGYGTVHRAVYELAANATCKYWEVRKKVQQWINAPSDEEIIYTKGTTESINLVASSFGRAFILPGDDVIISEIEHHSNIVPWQMICLEKKANLKVIPVNDQGELRMDVFASLLSDRTKIVAIGHLSNALGTVHPVKKITQMAHAYGAKVLVDGAQAAAHMKVDVQDINCDFYAFSGHKMYGPTGVGILYGKKELLEKMPPYQGGGDMIEHVSFEKTTYNTPPLKFEAGTPMITEIMGLGKTIDYLSDIGIEKIEAYEQLLLSYATDQIEKIKGVRIIGSALQKGAIISFVVDGVHSLDIGTMLDFKGIAIRTGHHCAQPAMTRFGVQATARVSFGIYNTKAEIDYFIESLKHIINQLLGS